MATWQNARALAVRMINVLHLSSIPLDTTLPAMRVVLLRERQLLVHACLPNQAGTQIGQLKACMMKATQAQSAM